MNLIKIMEMFTDQVACIEYLERLRWQRSLNVRIVSLYMSTNAMNSSIISHNLGYTLTSSSPRLHVPMNPGQSPIKHWSSSDHFTFLIYFARSVIIETP